MRWIGHGGSLRGFDLHVVRYPDHGLAIALLCNLEDISAERMAQRVADIYLSDAVAPPARAATASSLRVSLPGEQLIAKTGLYYEPSTEVLRRVFVRDGRLMYGGVVAREAALLLQRPNDITHSLRPTIADTFQDSRVGVTFTRDVRRDITGFLLNLRTGAGWEVRHVRFDRVRR